MPRKSKGSPIPGAAKGDTLGQRISRLRKKRGLTQVQLAEKLGITQTLLSEYERDNVRIHADTVVRLAKVLRVSTDALLGISALHGEDEKTSLRLVRRLKKIERLPIPHQKTILKTIDLFVKGAVE